MALCQSLWKDLALPCSDSRLLSPFYFLKYPPEGKHPSDAVMPQLCTYLCLLVTRLWWLPCPPKTIKTYKLFKFCYGLNGVPRKTKFWCWSPKTQYLRMKLYLERRPLKRGFSPDEAITWALFNLTGVLTGSGDGNVRRETKCAPARKRPRDDTQETSGSPGREAFQKLFKHFSQVVKRMAGI